MADAAAGQSPTKSFPRQPLLDDRVIIYILVIVKDDKPVPQGLAKDHPDNSRQKNTDPRNQPIRIRPCRQTAIRFQRAADCRVRFVNGRRNRRVQPNSRGFFLRSSTHEVELRITATLESQTGSPAAPWQARIGWTDFHFKCRIIKQFCKRRIMFRQTNLLYCHSLSK